MGNCAGIYTGSAQLFPHQDGFAEISNNHSLGQLEFIDQIKRDCLFVQRITSNHSVVSGPYKFEFGLKSGFVLTSVLSRCY